VVANVCVVLPTYNEASTIEEVLTRLAAVLPEATLLVVDDGSPDGTADLAEATGLPGVTVLRRPGKAGLGAAYRAGLSWAATQGHDVAVAMDSDLSHEPEVAPELVAAVAGEGVELAIGSRYVKGGGTENWPLQRRLLSRGGNVYARLMLGLRTRDATAGFRAYRLAALTELGIGTLASEGYAFQLEAVHRIARRFGRDAIVEVPITFRERVAGRSKMSSRIAVEAMWRVTWWGLAARLQGLRRGRSGA
jgi:dolichol-phosphate mannosyltransferase